ncbi:PREDICTED: WD repeat-containing protein 55-like [Priapulus caudatus]|uniref:WD repeat-containing protein 55 homolog n=1 Tax=Priapulus caudatus TaxID=37621 RepID=A0ABM1EIQ1_PRICU|nr:PREDICTED: WD repeat-containing protein 55-like [Priapulus caudatus]
MANAVGEESGPEKNFTVPPEATFDSIVVDFSFHTEKDILAAGLIEGDIAVRSFSRSKEGNNQLMTFTHHKKACRCVKFSRDSSQLFTTAKDKSICSVDMETGTVTHRQKNAHNAPVYSMAVIDDYLLATGDDDGNLKVWDYRRWTPIVEWKESEEFISDMAIDSNKRTLVATSGEGTLTAYSVRSKKMILQSELMDSEFLSVAIVDKGKKVVCGNGEGVLNFFNWGEWGNISDRFPGHPDSIDTICPITDNIICTGSMDGKVRGVHVMPNRMLGVVGEHEDFPIDHIRLSRDGSMIASCGHDEKIKFWDTEHIRSETVDHTKKARKGQKLKNLQGAGSDFFAGLMDDKADDE